MLTTEKIPIQKLNIRSASQGISRLEISLSSTLNRFVICQLRLSHCYFINYLFIVLMFPSTSFTVYRPQSQDASKVINSFRLKRTYHGKGYFVMLHSYASPNVSLRRGTKQISGPNQGEFLTFGSPCFKVLHNVTAL